MAHADRKLKSAVDTINTSLQWDRDIIVADRSGRDRRVSEIVGMLQWGRDIIVADRAG